MKRFAIYFLALLWLACGPNAEEKQMQKFIDVHVEKIKPLYKKSSLAYWKAATTGDAEQYDRYAELDLEIRTLYSNKEDFQKVKAAIDSGRINNPVILRQLQILYNSYLENQIAPELMRQIVDLGAKIEKDFNTYRGTINGRSVTSNDINEILKNETDSSKRKAAWLASKQVGPVVAENLVRLAKLRNKAAQTLGFIDYHELSLASKEQNRQELDEIFSELEALTNAPFASIKAELDTILADVYGIGVEGLLPWHYHDPFFQETPLVYELDLDKYYSDRNIIDIATTFYKSIGMPVESIIENSDLYERDGKNPHAFCIDIDRSGDVRVLCNLKNDERWMETLLHELGHAVYDYYQDPKCPYILRTPAHSFTTEAIAMLFGRFSRNADWMGEMLELSSENQDEIRTVSEKYSRLKQLIFARWAMVMYHFEKELYADPNQDLNELWWDLVERYQMIHRPPGRNEPDWAAKIHFAIAPCYYHNYLLGELLASQLFHDIAEKVYKSEDYQNITFINNDKVGRYLRTRIFETGSIYRWDMMILNATGETLTPKYFVQQFVQ
ncbi:M2 family metallopeptidase [candidate division KSB1 bacterium]|nr:M2 family metallopeptidase [candidate division KSB1 bacterium]